MDEKIIEENKEKSNRTAAASEEPAEKEKKEANKSSDTDKVESHPGNQPIDGEDLTSAESKEVVGNENKKVDDPEAQHCSDTESVDSQQSSTPHDEKEHTSDESFISCSEWGVVIGDDSTTVVVFSGDDSTTATGDEIKPHESTSITPSLELGETSGAKCGMGAEGGARQKEIKGILAVKIKTPKKKILSATPEIFPENIGEPPNRKNIVFNLSEEDSGQKEKAPPKNRINFDPVMTVRFYSYYPKDEDNKTKEPETSPGRELLEDIEGRLKMDTKFTSKRGDQHRSSFRHQQTVSRIAETREWSLGSDDVRYGVHRVYSDPPPVYTESCWSIIKTNVTDCLCCCCTPSTCRREEVEDDKRGATLSQQQGIREYGASTSAMLDIEDASLNYNASMEEEAKPKRVGRMKRIRRFFKRLFCCTGNMTTFLSNFSQCRED